MQIFAEHQVNTTKQINKVYDWLLNMFASTIYLNMDNFFWSGQFAH